MSLESRIIKPINYFRTSPYPFEAKEKEGVLFKKNPENNINPLGDMVSELRMLVMSDTHWHVRERISYDRTASLPTTRLANLARKISCGQTDDWHKNSRPYLYNQSLHGWPSAVGDFLAASNIHKPKHVLCVHAGDIGDDSLNQSELSEALLNTDSAMAAIKHVFEFDNPDVNVQQIQLLGDHDVDMRAWVGEGMTRQIQWFYDRKGIDQVPACYLQEVGAVGQQGSGVLMLDTNLLDDDWVEKVKTSAYRSLGRPPFNYGSFDDALDNDELKQYIYSFGRDVTIYDEVRTMIQRQHELIERAAEMKKLVIIGHMPRYLKSVAKTMNGNVTIIAGHRHKSYDSERIRQGANPRVLITGAPTFGAGGIEIKVKPMAYVVDITSAGDDMGISVASIQQ